MANPNHDERGRFSSGSGGSGGGSKGYKPKIGDVVRLTSGRDTGKLARVAASGEHDTGSVRLETRSGKFYDQRQVSDLSPIGEEVKRTSDARGREPATSVSRPLFQIGNTGGGRLRYRTGVEIAYREKKIIDKRASAKTPQRRERADRTMKKFFGNY